MKGSCKQRVSMEKTLSVNSLASKLLEKLRANAGYFGVKVLKMDCGATVIDAGVEAKGGFEAGRLITEICMGGCGRARITLLKYGESELPSIVVQTDHPVIATLGSQFAGWQINEQGYFAIGSGPARALALKPKEIYDEIGYKDAFAKAIMVLETAKTPSTALVERIAKDCNVAPDKLTVIVTPTTSIAGAVQVSGRIVETGIHKLRKLGLNPNEILHAWGCAPIPPVSPKFADAMARTNDAILYGGTAHYIIKHDDDNELKEIIQKAPSAASKQYGKPFRETFKEAKSDFYKIDPNLFAPASVVLTNILTGHTFKSGRVNVDAMAKSFDIEAA
jgi:methenyltetrahydromethanopterin cyclohydrolase